MTAPTAVDPFEQAKVDRPTEVRYTIVGVANGTYARFHSTPDVEDARLMLSQYRVVNPRVEYRLLRATTATVEDWVE